MILTATVPLIILTFITISKTRQGFQDAIGNRFELLSKEKANSISLIIEERTNEAFLLAQRQEVKDAVNTANQKYLNKSQKEIEDTIATIDEQWIATKGVIPLAGEIIDRDLSVVFKDYKDKNPNRYGEIFITDEKGAVIAMTKSLSDYYQADEEWWSNAFSSNKEDVFIDDRGYDESVDSLVVGVVVPVIDNGKSIGILKINYKINEILDIVAKGESSKTGITFLARSQGEIVTISPQDKEHQINELEQQILSQNSAGYVTDFHQDKQTIMGYAPVDALISTRVESPGQRKGISGEKWENSKWFLFIETDQSEAYSLANQLQNQLIILSSVSVFLVLIIALISAYLITNPINKLTHAIINISQGKLDTTIEGADRKDEVGSLAQAFERTVTSLKLAIRRTHPEAVKEQQKLVQELQNKKQTGDKIKLTIDKLEKAIPDKEENNG